MIQSVRRRSVVGDSARSTGLASAVTRRSVIASLAVLTACKRAGGSLGERPLRLVAPSAVNGLDPAVSGFIFRSLSVAETLLRVDRHGQLQPALATGYTSSEDSRLWRFRLRKGLIFHNGRPVTPQSILDALSRARDNPAAALHSAPISHMAVVGDDLVVELARPFSLMAAFLAAPSSIILAPEAFDGDGATNAIIGSGPYRILGRPDADAIQLVADLKRGHGLPVIRRVTYLAVADADTRARMIQAGDADIGEMLAPAAVDRLSRSAGIRVEKVESARLRYIMVNAANPLLADPNVRRALSLALDRSGAARTILRDPDVAATQMMPPILPQWRLGEAPELHHDPPAAEKLLELAGWRRGDDGVRRKDGRRLSLNMATYSLRAELPAVAESIQDQWGKVGVELGVTVEPPQQILRRARDGSLETALIARGYFDVPDVMATIATDFVASSQARGWGAVGWRSVPLEGAIAEYEATTDETVRAASRRRILEILHRELPIIPHSWYRVIGACADTVAGSTVDPFEISFGLDKLRWS